MINDPVTRVIDRRTVSGIARAYHQKDDSEEAVDGIN